MPGGHGGPGGPGGMGGMRGPGMMGGPGMPPPPPHRYGGWGYRRGGCCGPGCLMFVLGSMGVIGLMVMGISVLL